MSLLTKNKFVIPKINKEETIERTELIDSLISNSRKRLTVISSFAGSGRTTLIAQYVKKLAFPTVWYKIDENDKSPITLLENLINGFSIHYKGFGKSIITDLNEEKKYTDILKSIINEISQKINIEIKLIFDDYHLAENDDINNIVELLLKNLPNNLYLLISSRHTPQISHSNLIAQNQLLLLEDENINFNSNEILSLFKNIYKNDISTEKLKEIEELTDGWITGLKLIANNTDWKLQLKEYFSEILKFESNEMNEFLLQISPLRKINHNIISFITQISNSKELLEIAIKKHIVIKHENNHFKINNLLKNFLIEKLIDEKGKSYLKNIHNKSAKYWKEHNDWKEAIYHYQQIQSEDEIAEIISTIDKEIKQTDDERSNLLNLAEGLSDKILSKYPYLLLSIGRSKWRECKYQEAIKYYERSVSAFEIKEDKKGLTSALYEIGITSLCQGNWERVLQIALAGLSSMDTGDYSNVIDFSFLMGIYELYCGKIQMAKARFEGAIQSYENDDDKSKLYLSQFFLALLYEIEGKIKNALTNLEQLSKKSIGTDLFISSIVYSTLSRLHLYNDNIELSNNAIQNAIRLSRETNNPLAIAYSLLCYGNIKFKQGEFVKANEFYQSAYKLCQEHQINILIPFIDFANCNIALHNNDSYILNEFENKIKNSDQSLNIINSLYFLKYIEILLSSKHQKILHDSDIIKIKLEKILSYLIECNAKLLVIKCKLLLYRFNSSISSESESNLCYLIDAINTSKELGIDKTVKCYIETHPELLFNIIFYISNTNFTDNKRKYKEELSKLLYEIDDDILLKVFLDLSFNENLLMRKFVVEHLDRFNTKAVPILKKMLNDKEKSIRETASESLQKISKANLNLLSEKISIEPQADIKIYLFGKVRVIVGNKNIEIQDNQWHSPKTKELFCYFALHNKQSISKNTILDLFWNENDYESAEKNFHPTISYIRKLLRPILSSVKESKIIIAEKGFYKLDPSITVFTDVSQFEQLLKEAMNLENSNKKKSSVEKYKSAIEIYTGDYCDDFISTMWEEEREYYRQKYIFALKSIGDFYFEQNDYYSAIEFYQKIIQKDSYLEDIHRLLMQCYSLLGNKSALVEQYEKLCKILKDDMNIKPSDETEKLYRKLLGK